MAVAQTSLAEDYFQDRSRVRGNGTFTRYILLSNRVTVKFDSHAA